MADTGISEGGSQVLTVYLGGQVFGIPILKIQDVLRSQSLTHVPLSHGYIGGIMNLRGRIVTAVDLRRRIGVEADPAAETMNVVVEHGGELYSLIVDKVGDVLMLDLSQIEKTPVNVTDKWGEFSLGVTQLKNTIMIILDTDKLLDEEAAEEKKAV